MTEGAAPPTAAGVNVEADRGRNAATRRIFWIILWVSCAIGFVVHLGEEPERWRIGAAAGVLAVLALWLHGVHRIERWPDRVPPTRTVVMLLGSHVALAALLGLAPAYLIVLFGAFSLTFAFVDRVDVGLSLSFLIAMVWTWAWFRWDLPPGGALTPVLVWAVLNVINHFVTQVADQSEERGRLLDELQRTRAQLAVVERQRGTMAERERLAAEIHDTLAQGFTSIVLVSEATRLRAGDLAPEVVDRNLSLIEETARTNLDEARRLVDALRPATLEGRSLVEALELSADRVARRTGWEVAVEVIGDPDILGGSHDVVLLRAAQEALANCEKHAGAATIRIVLDVDPDHVRLHVVDDGAGFDPGAAPSSAAGSTGGHGMALMRRRADELGGTVDVQSAPGAGTTVTVTLPRAAVAPVDAPSVGAPSVDAPATAVPPIDAPSIDAPPANGEAL